MNHEILPIRNNLVLELHIPDFETARRFYKKFGFEEVLYDPASGGGSDLGYMVLGRKDDAGDTLLNFYGDKPKVAEHAYFNQFSPTTPRGYGVEITVPVADVTALWRLVSEQLDEPSIVQPLIEKRWGKSDFRVADPFGFYVRFTELVDWGQAG